MITIRRLGVFATAFLSAALLVSPALTRAQGIPTRTLSAPPGPGAGRIQQNFTVQSDIPYCTMGRVTLMMDVYTPGQPAATMPLVIYVHGGGWTGGDKSEVNENDKQPTLDALTQNGYVVASINYRLAPQYRFPAMIEDAKCAVRYFRTFPTLYHIDPTRIAAWGSSAGGHLAALMGVADTSARWDVGPYLNKSSRVESVVDWYGVSDLNTMPGEAPDMFKAVLVFGPPSRAAYAQDSPVTYVTHDDAPFLLQHGLLDTKVPDAQSQEMSNDLMRTRVYDQLALVQNAGHMFVPTPAGALINPTLDAISQQVVSFLNGEVKDNPRPLPQ